MSRGVLFSQFLRVIRNNTDRTAAELQLSDLADQFAIWGYSTSFIDEQPQRAKRTAQDELLSMDNKETQIDFYYGLDHGKSVALPLYLKAFLLSLGVLP